MVKKPPVSAGYEGDLGSIPGLGRSPEEGNDNSLQYSCLENFMDREAWRAMVHGVSKSWTRLRMHIGMQSILQILIKVLVLSFYLFLKLGTISIIIPLYIIQGRTVYVLGLTKL